MNQHLNAPARRPARLVLAGFGLAAALGLAGLLAQCQRRPRPAASRAESGGSQGARPAQTPSLAVKVEGHQPATLAWHALDLPAPLAQLLTTGQWDQTPKQFRVVTLSFLADSCVGQAQRDPDLRDAARDCVRRCLELAQSTRPSSLDVRAAEEGLWLSHLNLILGASDVLGECLDSKRHQEISAALARKSLRESTFHVPSYPDQPYRWPADQSATLAGLARYDRGHGTTLARGPVQKWIEFIEQRAWDASLQLPWSEATGRAKGAREPRGCALSWQTRYLREFAPALAVKWWQSYRTSFLVDALLLVGFREWPAGRERPADLDSGPIVRGLGAAATALGIGAARAMGDGVLAAQLEATAAAVESLGGAAASRAASTMLAAAILRLGAFVPGSPPNVSL